MKIAIITDTHCGCRNDSEIFAEYQADYYQNQFFPYLEKNGIDTILHGGDIIDRRNFINFKSLDGFLNSFLLELRKRKMKMYLIVGNHDVFFRTTNDLNSPTVLFNEFSDVVEIHTGPTTLELDGMKIDMIPWINNNNLSDTMDFIKKSDSPACLGHFSFAGFEMNKGVVADSGMSTKPFEDYDIVMSGHYHTRSKKKNVVYLGSPFEYNWGDCNDPRGFHTMDTNNLELDFVRNTVPMFYKFIYDDVKNTYDHHFFSEYDFDQYNGKYVKVIVNEKQSDDTLKELSENIEAAGVYDLQVVDDSGASTAIDVEVTNVKETKQLMDDYVDANYEGSAAKMKKILSVIYKEALADL